MNLEKIFCNCSTQWIRNILICELVYTFSISNWILPTIYGQEVNYSADYWNNLAALKLNQFLHKSCFSFHSTQSTFVDQISHFASLAIIRQGMRSSEQSCKKIQSACPQIPLRETKRFSLLSLIEIAVKVLLLCNNQRFFQLQSSMHRIRLCQRLQESITSQLCNNYFN